MKVFISWSGERSKQVANIIDEWLQCTIQSVQPWLSSRGIDRGELWFTAISNELAQTSIGIICLTQENKDKPWILFETGALAKGLSSNRVCTFLIDLQPVDLENPLAQFNHTFPNRESMLSLLQTINDLSEARLSPNILEKVFNKYWDEFKENFDNALLATPYDTVPLKRDKDDILVEILNSVRSFDKRLRNVESDRDRKTPKLKDLDHYYKTISLFDKGVNLDDFSNQEYANIIRMIRRNKNDNDDLDPNEVVPKP